MLATSGKTVTASAEWIADDAGKVPLRRLTVPLAINGIVRSGLNLQMFGPRATPDGRPFYDLRANLFAIVNGSYWHLGRLEFDPIGPPPHHQNIMEARGFAPPTVTGAHHHSFAENARIGLHCFEPASNLPVALPEDKAIRRYDDVLSVVRNRFAIPDFWTEDPSWLLLLA